MSCSRREEQGELLKSGPVLVDEALRLPQHVDKHAVIMTVEWDLLRQLGAKAEVRHTDHAAPSPCPLHRPALRLGHLGTSRSKNIYKTGL